MPRTSPRLDCVLRHNTLDVVDATAFITGTYERADAFLFGRRTYALFSASGAPWIRAAIRSLTP
jgi:hypothetical protein